MGKARTPSKGSRSGGKPAAAKSSTPKASNSRGMVMFVALIAGLTLTSVLLLAIAPPPLAPGASETMISLDGPDNVATLFRTEPPLQRGQWTCVYVHHSRTAGGNAETLAQGQAGLGDHFVIGNGEGCGDGTIQIGQRWKRQQPALPPAGARSIDPGYISVCLVGDFDRSVPTPTQVRRLTQLVTALQDKLDLPREKVLVVPQPDAASGIGRYFPLTVFKGQLLN